MRSGSIRKRTGIFGEIPALAADANPELTSNPRLLNVDKKRYKNVAQIGT